MVLVLRRFAARLLVIPRFALFFLLLMGSALFAPLLAWLMAGGFVSRQVLADLFRYLSLASLTILDLEVDFETHVKGDGSPCLYVANHISYFDIAVLGYLFSPSFLAKAEIGTWPLVGGICRAVGGIFVARDSLSERLAAINGIRRTLASGKDVALFPEGTTSSAKAPLAGASWYAGHLEAARIVGARVVAVGIAYEDQTTAAWVGDDTFLGHLMRQFWYGPRRVVVLTKDVLFSPESSPRTTGMVARMEVASLCLAGHKKLETIKGWQHYGDALEYWGSE